MSPKPKISHRAYAKTVIDALEGLHESGRLKRWKMQSGLFKSWTGEPAGKIGTPGVPDICGITPQGKFFGVEIKVGRDKQSPKQIEFQSFCEKAGALYIVFDERGELEDLINLILKS